MGQRSVRAKIVKLLKLHTIAGTPCRATRVALHVSQLISWILERFAGVAPVSRYTLKILVSLAPPPPPVPGGVALKFGSEKVSRYTGVSQLQLRVSRYTVQLDLAQKWVKNGFLIIGW